MGLKGQRGSNGGGSLDKTAATKVATKKPPVEKVAKVAKVVTWREKLQFQ